MNSRALFLRVSADVCCVLGHDASGANTICHAEIVGNDNHRFATDKLTLGPVDGRFGHRRNRSGLQCALQICHQRPTTQPGLQNKCFLLQSHVNFGKRGCSLRLDWAPNE